MGKELGHFSKEDIRMVMCTTSLVIKDMHIKITQRHCYTPTGMAIFKTRVNYREDVKTADLPSIASRNTEWCSCLEKSGQFFKKLH